jgi:uncharacterized protein DUF6777
MPAAGSPAPVEAKKSMDLKRLVPLVLSLVVAATSIFFFISSKDSAQAAVVYEDPLAPGPDPFTSPVDVSAVGVGALIPTPTPEVIATTNPSGIPSPQGSQPSPGQTGGGGTLPPTKPGNFGGTGFTTVCDRELLVRQLAANPAAMAAWGAVHGISAAQVPSYIRGLRPSSLARDTRVTNHSFKKGKAVAFQSIQPAGTAVLIDDAGRVVVRCRCGNPLLEPIPARGSCKGCPKGYQVPKLLPRNQVPPVVVVVNPPKASPAGAPVPTTSPSAPPSGAVFTGVAGRWRLDATGLQSGPSDSCQFDPGKGGYAVEQNGSSLVFKDPDPNVKEQLTGTVKADGRFDVGISDSSSGQTYTTRLTGRFVGNKIVDGRASLAANGVDQCVWGFTGARV